MTKAERIRQRKVDFEAGMSKAEFVRKYGISYWYRCKNEIERTSTFARERIRETNDAIIPCAHFASDLTLCEHGL